jgi:nitrogen fixation/metabolism regulation signal transduction histidine kinase
MLAPRTIRRRMFLAIFAVALVPAAAGLLLGTYLLSEAGATSGTLGPWDLVAASGESLVDEALRAAPGDSALVRAAESHREALSASVRQSRLWAYVADRFARALPLFTVVSVLLLGGAAFTAAGVLSRSFSRPVAELVGWTRRIALSEPLPPSGLDSHVVEFAQLAEALRRMAAELAEGRSREIESARLRAWSEMARRIAHDLKNPLTPMQLAASMLARSKDAGTVAAASVLLEEIARLDDMARSFSQLGRAPESPMSDVDLGELLQRLAERHASDAVQIRVHGADPTDGGPDIRGPVIAGHYDVLERVFRNLIVNAVEATEPEGSSTVAGGGVQPVDVHLIRNNGRVRVTIRDHGAGLPEGLSEAIWLPDVTTKRRGTGLGLAIVRQGVESHGGQVRARNAEGGGAEFEVIFPGARARDERV